METLKDLGCLAAAGFVILCWTVCLLASLALPVVIIWFLVTR